MESWTRALLDWHLPITPCQSRPAKTHVNDEFIPSDPAGPPLGFEVALVTDGVDELYQRAISAGATKVSEPETKPWGQMVAYVRDCNGNLVELCTPIG